MEITILQTVAEFLCREEIGAAAEALGDDWRGPGIAPLRQGRDDTTYARLLMLCGVLTMKLGVMTLAPVRDASRDMLSKSARLFGDNPEGQAARLWTGITYIQSGEYHEAIVWADSILTEGTSTADVTFSATLTRAIAELRLGDATKSLKSLEEIRSLYTLVSDISKGKYCLQLGIAYRQLKRRDEALLAYDEAAEQFHTAGSPRHEAQALNNIAGIYLDQGSLLRAQVYADRAVSIFRSLGDKGCEAKAWDTIANIHLIAGRYRFAVRAARKSVNLLTDSNQEGWLAEALITLAAAAAHLGHEESVLSLTTAAEISERLGNQEQADLARQELWNVVRKTKELGSRLLATVQPVEKTIIERALDKHEGRIARAANELGMKHQLLDKRIRALGLSHKRQTPVKRKRSIMR